MVTLINILSTLFIGAIILLFIAIFLGFIILILIGAISLIGGIIKLLFGWRYEVWKDDLDISKYDNSNEILMNICAFILYICVAVMFIVLFYGLMMFIIYTTRWFYGLW